MKREESFKIYLSAYDHKLLDESTKRIVKIVQESGSQLAGPVPLPTKVKRYTVLSSPHKYKDAREQFEMRIHKRMLEISNSNPKIISSLSSFSLPAGVGIEIKQIV